MSAPTLPAHPHLRTLGEHDEAFYVGLYRCPAAMRHVGGPIGLADAQRGFRDALRWMRASPARAHYWVAVDPGSAVTVGLVGLVPDRDAVSSAELGVLLAAGMGNRGYATGAIRSVCAWAFTAGGLARLWTRHAGGHEAARRLMLCTGFERCGPPTSDPAEWRWQRRADGATIHGGKPRAAPAAADGG